MTNWFTVFVSNTTGRITLHDEYCTAPEKARRARKGLVYEVEAETAEDAARLVTENEQLVERGIPAPRICGCCWTDARTRGGPWQIR